MCQLAQQKVELNYTLLRKRYLQKIQNILQNFTAQMIGFHTTLGRKPVAGRKEHENTNHKQNTTAFFIKHKRPLLNPQHSGSEKEEIDIRPTHAAVGKRQQRSACQLGK